jgi:NitT/TauT family transport system permease protein
MLRGSIRRWQAFLLGLLSILILLGGYTYLSHRQHIKNPDDTTLPSWGKLKEGVATAVEPNKRSGERWLVGDLAATMSRLFLGLFYGVVGAIILGVLMGCFPRIEAFLVPPLSILAKIPPTAALAVFFVLFGTDLQMYVAMIAFGILPTLAQSVYLSVVEVPDELLDKAYTLGASKTELIWNVIVRITLPKMIDGVRLLIGPAMVYLIAAEMVCGDVGFGYRIRLQSRLLNMNVVYPYLAILAIFGFTMDILLRLLQRVCSPWYTGRES